MNIEFALDEGLANPGEEYMLYYSERLPWWVEVTVTGQPGHGSQFIPDSAGERLRAVVDRFMDYRQTQKDKMEKNNLPIGEVTTVNLTMLQGGVQYNVVPAEEYFQKISYGQLKITISKNIFLNVFRIRYFQLTR